VPLLDNQAAALFVEIVEDLTHAGHYGTLDSRTRSGADVQKGQETFMSLLTVGDKGEAPIRHQSSIQPGHPKCPLKEFSWISIEDMPEGRLPKHIQFATELMKVAMEKKRNDFSILEGQKIIREIFPGRHQYARHELNTLVTKGLAKNGSGETYEINRKAILFRIQDYVRRI